MDKKTYHFLRLAYKETDFVAFNQMNDFQFPELAPTAGNPSQSGSSSESEFFKPATSEELGYYLDSDD